MAGKNPFADPFVVTNADGLREFCMGGAVLLDLSALLTQAQNVLKQSLRNSGHSYSTSILVARPIGMAAEDLRMTDRHLRMCWASACRRLPELNGSAPTRQAGGIPGFTVPGQGRGGGAHR